jgi:hypothetical protein
MFIYRVPRDPTSCRVYVWRKLKQLGAVAMQDAIWVLPATARTREQFQWLAAEIAEMKGDATIWQAELLAGGQEDELVRQFTSQVDVIYREIQTSLKRKRPDLAALARRYQQAESQDYFQSKLGKQVREALLAARANGLK